MAPAATRATPEKEITVAAQWRRRRRSSPNAQEMSATKIGRVPNMSATVAAVVSFTAKTKESWFSQMPESAAPVMKATSRRRTARLPSRAYV